MQARLSLPAHLLLNCPQHACKHTQQSQTAHLPLDLQAHAHHDKFELLKGQVVLLKGCDQEVHACWLLQLPHKTLEEAHVLCTALVLEMPEPAA